jgi:hypothetical protein
MEEKWSDAGVLTFFNFPHCNAIYTAEYINKFLLFLNKERCLRSEHQGSALEIVKDNPFKFSDQEITTTQDILRQNSQDISDSQKMGEEGKPDSKIWEFL